MSLPVSERISFTLSNLQKHLPEADGSRRRVVPQLPTDDATDSRGRSLAAAAGAATSFDDVESTSGHDHVDVRKFLHPPPTLKSRRCCCVTIIVTWTLFSTTFFIATLMNIHSMGLFQNEDASLERRIVRDNSIPDFVSFGVWDSRVSITPLQLQVVVSMALGVRASDDDVHVYADDESFFDVRVDHANAEEIEYIASPAFLTRLNTHMAPYGGIGVLSRPPKLHKNATAIAP